ncbi:MAG: class I SAM-dependent methyltransferase, partial [Calditrichaeota bacterium]|nr:class I SAM-dependent methyltransferase [Calditrichota bacterium]
YRRLTPKMRTVDEHPLLFSDLNLANDFFSSVRKRYFGLTSFMAVPFFKTPFFIPILNFFDKLDEVILFLLPFLKKYAWIVVLDLSSPKTKL